LRWGSLLDVNFDSSFLEQTEKTFIVIFAKADESFYSGVNQHLGAKYAWRMGAVNRACLQTDAVKGGLDNNILLGVNTPTDFVSFPRRNAEGIS
jgi:hypothetical protein